MATYIFFIKWYIWLRFIIVRKNRTSAFLARKVLHYNTANFKSQCHFFCLWKESTIFLYGIDGGFGNDGQHHPLPSLCRKSSSVVLSAPPVKTQESYFNIVSRAIKWTWNKGVALCRTVNDSKTKQWAGIYPTQSVICMGLMIATFFMSPHTICLV